MDLIYARWLMPSLETCQNLNTESTAQKRIYHMNAIQLITLFSAVTHLYEFNIAAGIIMRITRRICNRIIQSPRSSGTRLCTCWSGGFFIVFCYSERQLLLIDKFVHSPLQEYLPIFRIPVVSFLILRHTHNIYFHAIHFQEPIFLL